MGNCLTQGAKTWAVDNDDESWNHHNDDHIKPKIHKPLPKHHNKSTSPSNGGSTSTRTVKIKLTRKQLEEILGRAGAGHNTDQTLPIELLLKHALKKGCGVELVQDKNRHWQPALQTIPEACE